MSGLPKAYAKMGFVRGWKAYKARNKTPTTRTKTTMARRKTRRSKGFKRSAKRSGKSSSGFGMNKLMGVVIGASIYGAGREFASNKLQPVFNKIPAGDLADEVGMGILSYFIAKGKIPLINRIPYSKEIGLAGLTIESARVGAYLGAKFMPMGVSTTSTAKASTEAYNY